MTGAVGGDPASCSQLGGTLRQLATRLRTTGRAAHDAFDSRRRRRRRARARSLVQARRRVDLLDAATAAAAREVDRVGTALQAHASRPGRGGRRQPPARPRAPRRPGCGSSDGRGSPRPGASAASPTRRPAPSRTPLRDRLQGELDAVAALVGQRRHRLAAALRESQDVLATHAGALRR